MTECFYLKFDKDSTFFLQKNVNENFYLQFLILISLFYFFFFKKKFKALKILSVLIDKFSISK